MPKQPTKDVVTRAILSMGCKYAAMVLRKKMLWFFFFFIEGQNKK